MCGRAHGKSDMPSVRDIPAIGWTAIEFRLGIEEAHSRCIREMAATVIVPQRRFWCANCPRDRVDFPIGGTSTSNETFRPIGRVPSYACHERLNNFAARSVATSSGSARLHGETGRRGRHRTVPSEMSASRRNIVRTGCVAFQIVAVSDSAPGFAVPGLESSFGAINRC